MVTKITNKMALDIIDIVGEETVKVYTKTVFNVEDDNTQLAIEKIISEEEK